MSKSRDFDNTQNCDISVGCVAVTGASVPQYASAGSAGADLAACMDAPMVINPGDRIVVSTGLRIAIPEGFEGQVRPRSGLALKHGVTVLNSPGTIDSDYRGEVKVILINLGTESFTVRSGDRIAQLVIAPVQRVTYDSTGKLDVTERNNGGFGSTGVSD